MKKRYLRMVRGALRSLRHPRLRNRQWWKVLTKPVADRNLWIPCRDSIAHGLAIGFFFSMILMPFQMIAAALVGIRAKANIPFTMAACWVTNPITVGPILWGQCALGQWMRDVLGVPMPRFMINVAFKAPEAGSLNAASLLLGMITSALLLALLAYPMVHLFAAVMPHYLPVRKKKAESKHSDKSNQETHLENPNEERNSNTDGTQSE